MKQPPAMKHRRLALTSAAVIGGVALFIFDEIIFGAPILALTHWIGGWLAFIALVPIYFALDYTVGTLSLNGVKRWKSSGRQNRWSKKFSKTEQSNIGRFSYWVMVSGGTAGFFICSYLGTAFLTMPLVYLMGRRRHLRQLTMASAAIYALTFVGQYAGIGAWLFK